MADPVSDLFQFLSQVAGSNQLLFVFLVSLFGNIIPIIPIPYLLLVIAVAVPKGPGIVQIAAVSALGASIGKYASYVLGYGVRAVSKSNQRRFDSLRGLLGGSVFLVAFIFAATPLPDDVAYIPMGIMRYSPAKTFISLYSGKFALILAVLFTARESVAIQDSLGGGVAGSILTAVVIIILVAYLMVRVDWERILTETSKGSLRGVFRKSWNRLRGRPDESPAA